VTHAAYVYAGYVVTGGILAAYAGWIAAKSRRLRRQK
jgi:hypothetical protein